MSAPDVDQNSVMVVGRFVVDPEDVEAFLAQQLPGVVASRAEPRCLRYVVGADLVEPGVVNLFEHWESKAALADHLALLRARPALAEPRVAVVKAEIRQFDAGPPGRVGS